MGKKSLEERVTEEAGFLCSAIKAEEGMSHPEGWANCSSEQNKTKTKTGKGNRTMQREKY